VARFELSIAVDVDEGRPSHAVGDKLTGTIHVRSPKRASVELTLRLALEVDGKDQARRPFILYLDIFTGVLKRRRQSFPFEIECDAPPSHSGAHVVSRALVAELWTGDGAVYRARSPIQIVRPEAGTLCVELQSVDRQNWDWERVAAGLFGLAGTALFGAMASAIYDGRMFMWFLSALMAIAGLFQLVSARPRRPRWLRGLRVFSDVSEPTALIASDYRSPGNRDSEDAQTMLGCEVTATSRVTRVTARFEVHQCWPDDDEETSWTDESELERDGELWHGLLLLPLEKEVPWLTFSQDGCALEWSLQLRLYVGQASPEIVTRQLHAAFERVPTRATANAR
jgi:hypothetical protein